MTPSALNTLFGVPANQAATAKPASNSTAFGDMLTREIKGRQNAAPPQPPQNQNPRADNPPPASRAPQQNATKAPDAPKPEQRQSVNASQSQQSDAPRNDQKADATAPGESARSDSTDAPAVAKGEPADGVEKAPGTGKKDKSEKGDGADQTDASDTAATAGDQVAVSPASAELLALVASLMPRSTAAVPAAVAVATAATSAAVDPAVAAAAAAVAMTAGAIAPNAPSAKSTTVGLPAGPAGAAAEMANADPAFDALLAQAANSTAARSHSKTEAGAGKASNPSDALPAVRTDPDAAQTRNNTTPAAALTVKADEIVLAAAAVQAATGKAEPTALSGLAGLSGAVPAGLTQAAAGTPPDTLTPHVGTPAWDHALGQKVVWMAAGAQQSASLMLNPPDLGPIQVVINVSNDQANASFTAAQPEVRQALEAALPRLKEMLGDAGITLGQASVSAGNPNQYGSADQQPGSSARRGSGGVGREPLDTDPVTRTTTRTVSSGTGLVDTFA